MKELIIVIIGHTHFIESCTMNVVCSLPLMLLAA